MSTNERSKAETGTRRQSSRRAGSKRAVFRRTTPCAAGPRGSHGRQACSFGFGHLACFVHQRGLHPERVSGFFEGSVLGFPVRIHTERNTAWGGERQGLLEMAVEIRSNEIVSGTVVLVAHSSDPQPYNCRKTQFLMSFRAKRRIPLRFESGRRIQIPKEHVSRLQSFTYRADGRILVT